MGEGHNKGLGRLVSPAIERVAGLALAGQPHANHFTAPASQQIQHLLPAAMERPPLAPPHPDPWRGPGGIRGLGREPVQAGGQPSIAVLPHRLQGPT